jgi:MFS family permease
MPLNGVPRTATDVAARATFRDVFAVPEYRAIWLAQLLSVIGDQLARVAMTVLVYDRTHSALWTAVTYAVTFVPWIAGGLLLSGLADRLPRRAVMVACDLARMALVALMALVSATIAGWAALWLMVAILFVVTLLDSPFKSARSAMLPDVLPGDRYVLGTAVAQTTLQVGQVTGFAAGGLVVEFLGVRSALLADAASFAVSAALIRFWVRARPAAARRSGRRGATAEMAAGIRLVFGDRTLRTLTLFGWLVAFYVVPMGLAAPYADRLQRPFSLPVTTGLVFAAVPFGTAIGAVIFGRLVRPDRRQRWMGPLAVAACGVLVLCWAQPDMIASLAIFAVSGMCASYQLAANAAFVTAVPPERRGQAFGLANGGMQLAQGAWIVVAGAAASAALLTPATAIAVSGGIGAAIAIALTLSLHWPSADHIARVKTQTQPLAPGP